MQVFLDSLFARPGSALIWGGKKREFRDWTRPVPEGMPMIFELEEYIELLDRLELGGEVTKITPGTSSHVTSLVSNNTDRNIFLKRKTELGTARVLERPD